MFLFSHNWIDFANRWLHLGNYKEVYDDIVEYWTKKKTPFNGTLDLKLSQGIRDVAYRVHKDQPMQIVQRVDITKPIHIVDRYMAMPKEVSDKMDEIIGGIDA